MTGRPRPQGIGISIALLCVVAAANTVALVANIAHGDLGGVAFNVILYVLAAGLAAASYHLLRRRAGR